VTDAAGKKLMRADALLVEVSAGRMQRALLVNPQQKQVVAALPGGVAWSSADALAVR